MKIRSSIYLTLTLNPALSVANQPLLKKTNFQQALQGEIDVRRTTLGSLKENR